MKSKIALVLVILCAVLFFVCVQGGDVELEDLKEEVEALNNQGKYDRALVVAQKALKGN